jgi:multiple sugar transport system substrate-binding protein
MNWRRTCMTGLATCLALALASCGTVEEEVAPAPDPVDEPEDPAPEVPDGVTVTWATIAGFYTDRMNELSQQFEEQTGIRVQIADIDFTELYQRQVVEMVGGTGAFDIVTMDAFWSPEWIAAGLVENLDDLAAGTDPAELALDDVAPILLDFCCVRDGSLYGLPYYTFTAGMYYRADLFEHPDEQAAFQERYGYELAPPTTWDQHRDMAEFFTREAGEELAGEVLDRNFYGVGLMADRRPHIQDEIMAMIWAHGGRVVNDDGTPGVDDPIELDAVERYVDLLQFAPPGAVTSAFPEVGAQMADGLIAMTHAFYLDQFANVVQVEDNVPGARLGSVPAPGNRAWIGAFALGVSRDSPNKEAAWEFVKFLASPETQLEFAKGGGTSARLSVMTNQELIEEYPDKAGHYPTLYEVVTEALAGGHRPNVYFVPVAGKIYEEMHPAYNAAATREASPQEAVQRLSTAITEICGGPCDIVE